MKHYLPQIQSSNTISKPAGNTIDSQGTTRAEAVSEENQSLLRKLKTGKNVTEPLLIFWHLVSHLAANNKNLLSQKTWKHQQMQLGWLTICIAGGPFLMRAKHKTDHSTWRDSMHSFPLPLNIKATTLITNVQFFPLVQWNTTGHFLTTGQQFIHICTIQKKPRDKEQNWACLQLIDASNSFSTNQSWRKSLSLQKSVTRKYRQA